MMLLKDFNIEFWLNEIAMLLFIILAIIIWIIIFPFVFWKRGYWEGAKNIVKFLFGKETNYQNDV